MRCAGFLQVMSMESLASRVKQLKTQKRTWVDVGEAIGISGALAWRVANGRSDSAVARHYFGMPPAVVETEPCPVCGDVHKFKTCVTKRRRREVDRMAARLTPEEGQRAREILRRLGYESVTEFWAAFLLYKETHPG